MLLTTYCQRIGFLLAVLSLLTIQVAPVQAAMLSNGDLLQQSTADAGRQHLKNLLERQQVQQQLIELGVDTDTVTERVDRMTDAEVAQINQRISELPAAGSGVLVAVLVVFLVFVITDMLGATDIFPTIKPVK